MNIFKEKVYPPQKLREIDNISGVNWNLKLLKSLTWIEHFSKIDNEDVVVCDLPPKPTRTRTVKPPLYRSDISDINQMFLFQVYL